jgi:hypothetical protein
MKLTSLVKSILKEDEVDDKLADLSDKFDTGTVEDYVATLQKYATDPKVAAVLKAGQTDNKGKADERFSVAGASPLVKDLKPTQNEIGAAESLKNILTDKFGSLDGFLRGSSSFPDPIIIYNDEYIIDGHHRWSQVYAANPDATIPALNITGNLAPDQILKVVHTAIAADAGQTKTIQADRSGGNLLKYTDQDVYDYVEANLNDKARKVWSKYGFVSDDEIAQHIATNVRTMISKSKPESWAPTRDSMPQPGVSGADEWGKLMKQGDVNFDQPKQSDIKDSVQKSDTLIESVKDRLVKLANIKK